MGVAQIEDLTDPSDVENLKKSRGKRCRKSEKDRGLPETLRPKKLKPSSNNTSLSNKELELDETANNDKNGDGTDENNDKNVEESLEEINKKNASNPPASANVFQIKKNTVNTQKGVTTTKVVTAGK